MIWVNFLFNSEDLIEWNRPLRAAIIRDFLGIAPNHETFRNGLESRSSSLIFLLYSNDLYMFHRVLSFAEDDTPKLWSVICWNFHKKYTMFFQSCSCYKERRLQRWTCSQRTSQRVPLRSLQHIMCVDCLYSDGNEILLGVSVYRESCEGESF